MSQSSVIANLHQAADAARDGAIRGLLLAAEHVLGEAVAVVPLLEGTLAHSGAARVDEENLTSTVSFGTVYATRQHEELTWRHAPGRQAKYLEEPWLREAQTSAAIIARAIREDMGTE